MELDEIQVDGTYTIEGHSNIPDGTSCKVVGIHNRYPSNDDYHPVRVKYELEHEDDNGSSYVQEHTGRVRPEHLTNGSS